MKQDILNRTPYIEQLIDIIECISAKKDSYCFAIDGKWGTGKTYVLEMLETRLREIQSEETADNKYFVFHYNCWEYDYYDEPSVAIISAMLRRIEQEEAVFDKVDDFAKSSWKKAKDYIEHIAGEFSKNKIGINIVETIQDINNITHAREDDKYKFDELYTFRKTLDSARDTLGEFAKEKSVILIVDELDRCIPTYAIKVMERLHHLFNEIDNITVVMAVDKKQLEHSVRQIYGDAVNVDEYLKKFIDFAVTLGNGEISKNFEDKYNEYLEIFIIDDNYKKVLKEFFVAMFAWIDIRTQEKIMAKAQLIHDLVDDQLVYDGSLMFFEILYLTLKYAKADLTLNESFIDNLLFRKYVGIDTNNALGYHISEYLKNTSKECLEMASGFTGKTINIKNTLYGKMYYIFYSIYGERPSDINRVYFPNGTALRREVQAAKSFVNLAEILV